MSADVKTTAAAVAKAEADIVAGKGVSALDLHKITDTFRHARLTAEGKQRTAAEERAAARLASLEEIGAAIDRLAGPEHSGRIERAMLDISAACDALRALAAAHDRDVAALIAAAKQLEAEPEAPAGPRSTSAHVAVKDKTIVHKAVRLAPVGHRVDIALGHALHGDPGRAAAEVRAVTITPGRRRPEHLFRSKNGMIHSIDNLNEGLRAQVQSGELVELTAYDIDLWMAGELA